MRGDLGGDLCNCGAFVTVAVTASSIYGKPDIWAGKDADPATAKSGYAAEAARRAYTVRETYLEGDSVRRD